MVTPAQNMSMLELRSKLVMLALGAWDRYLQLSPLERLQLGVGMIVALFALRGTWRLLRPRKGKAIPSVKGGWPFFGQVFDMVKGSPWDTMSNWVGQYGKIYKFHLFGSDAVCVTDPALLKIVLNDKQVLFRKDIEWTYAPFMVILGNGLVTSHGESWKRQRHLLAIHLRVDILDEIPEMGFEAVKRLSLKLDEAKKSGQVLEMAEQFRHLTLQVIAKALLSLEPEECDETFAKMYLPIVEEGNLRTWHPERMYMPGPAWFAFRAAVKRLNDYVTSLIEKRWSLKVNEEADIAKAGAAGAVPARKQDILDKILSAYTQETWGPGAVQQIRDEIKTFVLAGHETSASMLAWSLYELSLESNKACLDKVLEESSRVYTGEFCNDKGHVESLPSREALGSGLVYAEMCLRESLRKYSVVPTVVRKTAEEVQLGDFVLEKGATIMVNMQGVHHSPDLWPQPMVYRPERFEDKPAPYTFIPFADGPRSCLGQFLSLLESKVVLSALLKKYRFELTNPEDAGLKHSFMIPIIPKTGHFFKVHDR